jgi:hypothetical protein
MNGISLPSLSHVEISQDTEEGSCQNQHISNITTSLFLEVEPRPSTNDLSQLFATSAKPIRRADGDIIS